MFSALQKRHGMNGEAKFVCVSAQFCTTYREIIQQDAKNG